MSFSKMDPVRVGISITPFGESGARITCAWRADGEILNIERNFGVYTKTYEDDDIVFMRPYQDIDAIGWEFDSPLGKIYVAIMRGRESVRICDAAGNVREFPFEFAEGKIFAQGFIENDINEESAKESEEV